MLVKMKRSQATAIGMLRAGVAYQIDGSQQKELLDHLLKNKLAEKTTPEQLEKDADAIAVRQAAEQADLSDDGPATALREAANAELIAQADQGEKDKIKAETDADEAREALAATIAELAASKGRTKDVEAERDLAIKAAKKSSDALDLKTAELTEVRKSLDAANAEAVSLTVELKAAAATASKAGASDKK